MDMNTTDNNKDERGLEAQKRYDLRVSYRIEIFYPIINNVSIYKNYDRSTPLMTTVNISESGICFNTRLPIKVGDFISFMLQIGDNPSFWCLCEVKWVENKVAYDYVGCRFYLLSDTYINIIKDYVKNVFL
ncbi:MAG: PilZ domain-containing protein [Clostridiaceae bacterium]|nr:PilZ domain-containing protein [Clostridiaceae bacterium]